MIVAVEMGSVELELVSQSFRGGNKVSNNGTLVILVTCSGTARVVVVE